MEQAAPRRRELLVATVVAAAFVLLRLLWHPHFLLDDETTFVNTVGREWALGAPGAWTRYQLIPYQGSFLIDALLSSLGYHLVGDHLLAWFLVPMAYVAAFAALGAALCAGIGARWGLWLWVALLAGAPFLLKDGLISMPGGHTTSIVWVLLAVLAVDRALAGSDRAALAAGAIAGFATWYTRSAVIVAAVVPFVFLVSGRWQALRRALVGLSSLPLLLLLNGWALTVAGPWAGNDAPADVWSRLLWNIYGGGQAEWSPIGKLLEVVGLSGWRQLFAQPVALPGETVAELSVLPGAPWAAALALALVLAVVLLARRVRSPKDLQTVEVVALLAVLYAAAYVLSPLRVEPETQLFVGAPLPTMVRYLTPAMLVLLALLGLAAADLASRGGRARLVAAALVAAVALPGAVQALRDGSDRATEIWATRLPFKYYRVFGAHRGLPPALLAGWHPADERSDENRLLALGTFAACGPPCVAADPADPARRLAVATEDHGLDPQQRSVVARGMGMAFADHLWSSDEVGGDRLLGLAIEAAQRMSPRDGAAWLRGFGEVAAEDPALLRISEDRLVRELCGLELGGERPLCRAAGRTVPIECGDEGSSDRLRTRAHGVPPTVVAEALGWRHGRDLPPWERARCQAGLDEELGGAYAQGWADGARLRWRDGSEGEG